jgi:4-aminobutyrate aminotransferase
VKNNELNDRRLQATPRGIGVMCNFYADKAENATVWDVEGNEYIDFAAGIAVLNTGHRHPKVIPPLKNNSTRLPTRLPDCAVRRLRGACRAD